MYITNGTDIMEISPEQWAVAEGLRAKGWVECDAPAPEPEPITIPTSVTMRQARLQLHTLGIYDAVNNAVSGMSIAAQIEWEYAATVDRDNTFTQQMIQMLGWTEAEADTYFVEASKL
jgi:hypothetical protein